VINGLYTSTSWVWHSVDGGKDLAVAFGSEPARTGRQMQRSSVGQSRNVHLSGKARRPAERISRLADGLLATAQKGAAERGIDSATCCCHDLIMNEAQREVLKNVERAAHSAGNLAEKAYHLTEDQAAHKIAEAVLALSQTVGVLARALADEAK